MAVKFSGELTYIGTTDALVVRRLPLITLPWLVDEGPALPVLMGRNGRPRTSVTLPGHGKGRRPANYGKKFPPEPLTNEEALKLLAVIPQEKYGRPWPVGIRNHALITLLWRTGLRINEALDLRPHHIDFAGMRVTVLHSKGDKRRTVAIDKGGLLALQPWLLERALMVSEPLAPLFCTVQNPGKGNRLCDAYVRQALHEYGRRAGIPKRVHPHGWRHTLACDLVREGFSIVHVQSQLGHSNVATTAGYLRGLGADEAFDKVALREWPT